MFRINRTLPRREITCRTDIAGKTEKTFHRLATGILTAVFLIGTNTASAKCGGVDYSWGADALARQHDFVVTMMLYVLYLIYAVASIVVVYSSLQIYIKMNSGEDGIRKDIMTVVGACLFLIGASIVFPAFFGYRI